MTVSKFLLPALFFLALRPAAQAQSVPHELDSMFDRTLQTVRNSLGVKSLSAAVQLSNDSIWTGAYGISANFPQDSVRPDYAYAIGSVTKTITAACILQLADAGLLHIDDSLHTWLPAFPFVHPDITIRQLLQHTSGLYDVITNPAYDAATKAKLDSVWSLSNLVNDYMNPPLFAPGTSWSYSNTNYVLLGLIIEAATGNPYRTEFQNRFFTPLQLPSLLLPPYDPNPADIAHLWIYNGGTGAYTDAHTFYYNWDSFRTSAGPAGGYYGTARDIAVWTRAYLRGNLHSAGILTDAKTTISTDLPSGTRYGLGLMERTFLAQKAYGHGGDIGYSAISYYFPAKDISITVFNNDSKRNSWALAPVVQALLKNCMDYEASVAAHGPAPLPELPVQVYPNPFSTELQVSVDLLAPVRSAQLFLTDVLGREMARKELGALSADPQVIPLEGLENVAAGVYFVNLVLDGTPTKAAKVIK